MKENFIVEYVPQTKIDKMLEEHKEAMEEEGLESIWDIEDMAGHEENFQFKTRKEAEQKARELLPLDHFGQVGLYREVEIFCEGCRDWETVEQAFHTGEDEPIKWEKP